MSATAAAILKDFRDRRITYAEFERQMRPWLEIDFGGPRLTVRYRQPIDAHVPIAPGDVRQALDAFQARAFSEPELVRWATMLDVLTEFGPGPEVTDEEADRLDPMWNVLIRLAAPSMFGALTPETIAAYDAQLRNLESELSEGAA